MPRRRPPRAGALTDLPPLKILSQIVLLQAAWYGVATVMILFTTLVAGKRFSLELVLSWRSLRGDTTVGWTLGLCWMLDSLVQYGYLLSGDLSQIGSTINNGANTRCRVILLLVLVSRSKLVPDFALTIHFIHLVITSLYTRGPPTNLLWWALQICTAALMVFLGIWACQWRELRPMAFGKAKETPALPPEGSGGGEEDEGFSGFGRGRGRTRDGGGDYEMVRIKEEDENV
ncbi:hypothetical protein MMC13_003744 [Lambiella insularis]|nr:hypothetical protein [Lambiella insularis]